MKPMNLIIGDLGRTRKDKGLITIAVVCFAGALLMVMVNLGTFLFLINTPEEELRKMLESSMSMIGAVTDDMIDTIIASIRENPDSFKADLGFAALISVINSGLFVLIAAIGLAIFNGGDFTFNTIRNKVIAGNSRIKIYLSQCAVNLIIFFTLFLVTLAFTLSLCAIFLRLENFGHILLQLLLSLPLYISMVAIFTCISMATRSRLLGILISLALVIFLPVPLQIVQGAGLFNIPPNETAVMILESNPFSMLDTKILADFDAATAPSTILKAMLVALAYGVLATTAGLFVFNKADLK